MFKRSSYLAITLALAATTILSTPANAKSSKKTVKGPTGQTLTVSATSVRDGQTVSVTGKKYSKKVGIYLAYCVVNKKGEVPSPCGGGVNASGASDGSIWISSNPPEYGKSLAIPFSKSGGFKQKVKVSRYIGTIDCAIVKCAVVTRADHTDSTNRKADVIVPVKFKK
jgi:hypothetical protein